MDKETRTIIGQVKHLLEQSNKHFNELDLQQAKKYQSQAIEELAKLMGEYGFVEYKINSWLEQDN